MMKKLIITLMAITIGLLISVNAFAFRPGAGYGCPFGFGYGNGGVFMGILFLILLGVVIYFIVQNVRLKVTVFPTHIASDWQLRYAPTASGKCRCCSLKI